MYSTSLLVFLVSGMLFTGTINTLLNKLQDIQCVANCDDPLNQVLYEQPVWQTLTMFIGETGCFLAYYLIKYQEQRSYPPIGPEESSPLLTENLLKPMKGYANLLLWIPTLCDMTGTTLMNIGLLTTSASIYQMLRGSVVLFTGTFSVLFLHKRHPMYRWFALVCVFVGVLIVGSSSIIQGDPDTGHTTTTFLGVFLVVLAQVFTASQFVIEEKILSRYNVAPLRAVGLEGFFGLISVCTLMPVIYLVYGRHHPGSAFDLPLGYHQTVDYPQVLGAGIGIIFSIAFFNWFGLSVTRQISATARSTIDTCRTLFIWMSSLALGWENFKSLQVLGFIVMVYGTLTFNDVIKPLPWLSKSHEEESVD